MAGLLERREPGEGGRGSSPWIHPAHHQPDEARRGDRLRPRGPDEHARRAGVGHGDLRPVCHGRSVGGERGPAVHRQVLRARRVMARCYWFPMNLIVIALLVTAGLEITQLVAVLMLVSLIATSAVYVHHMNQRLRTKRPGDLFPEKRR